MFHFIRCLSTIFLMSICVVGKADLVQFNVSLDGGQEVPANASPGTGTAVVVFDDVSGNMTITGSYSGLTTAVSAAHLHGFAASGFNAGVIFGLNHTGGTAGTFTGNAVIAAGDIANVMNGLTYINVHNANFPGGEIRGQLINPVPEPTTSILLSAGVCALLLNRRR